MTKIVIVGTSATELKGHPTGLWIEELAAPYYQFKKAGYEVVVASPAGGAIPIDAGSMAEGFFTENAKKFMVSKACKQLALRSLGIPYFLFVLVLTSLVFTSNISVRDIQRATYIYYNIHNSTTPKPSASSATPSN